MLTLFIQLIAPNGDTYKLFHTSNQWSIRIDPYSAIGLDLWHYCPHIYPDMHSAIDSANQHYDSGVWINPNK